MKLGYPLPRFKDDGKFGPETLGALKKFQQDNGLTSSVGKLDRLTSKKLAELLKSKNIVGSEELQSSLNSM
jgi:peptidoglycan hydrolase-like protein with peptidoglycan-binding domain